MAFLDQLTAKLTYVASLPERTVRSLAATVGGTTKLLTDTVLPDFLKQTTCYDVIVGQMQRFVIEKVGQVEGVYQQNADEWAAGDEKYLQKKIAGAVVETAGLFAMRFSPLWVFALASDAAAGGSAYLRRLATELEKQGVIQSADSIGDMTDLLGAVESAGRVGATAIDTPPASAQEARQLADQLHASLQGTFAGVGNLTGQLNGLWDRMHQVAAEQNVSIEMISGLMSLDLARTAGNVAGGGRAVVNATTDLVGEKVLDSYAQTLEAVAQQGFVAYVQLAVDPYLQAVGKQFTSESSTWTESALNWLTGRSQPPSDS